MAAPIPAKKGLLTEFKEFLLQGDLVTIAVGLVMALYIKSIVDAILAGVINPIIAAIVGEPSLVEFGFDIGDARISIGLVIDAIIQFVIVGFLLFIILKAYNTARRKQPEADSGPTTAELLTEIRDELRRRPTV